MHGDFFGNSRPPEPPSWLTLVRAVLGAPTAAVTLLIAGADGIETYRRWIDAACDWRTGK